MQKTLSSSVTPVVKNLTTIRILFITDLHKHPQMFNKNLYATLEGKYNVVFIGGDMYNYNEENFVKSKDQSKKALYEDYVQFIQSIMQVPVISVLGNHDITNTGLKVPNSILLAENLTILTQNGSSSTIIADDLHSMTRPDQLDQEVLWKGVPWGPIEQNKTEFDKLINFTTLHRTEVSEQIQQAAEPMMLNVELDTDYNRNQIFKHEPQEDQQYVILSHQGPYKSATSWDIYNKENAQFLPEKYHSGLYFSSGSPKNQEFYDKYKQQIVAWCHGHSHHPKFHYCNQIFNPGKFPNYYTIILKKENGKWYLHGSEHSVLK